MMIFYDALTPVGCDYLMKYLGVYFWVIFSDTTVSVGGAFVIFPRMLRVFFFFFAMQMKLREGAWGKMPSCLARKTPLRGIFDSWSFPIYTGHIFPRIGC